MAVLAGLVAAVLAVITIASVAMFLDFFQIQPSRWIVNFIVGVALASGGMAFYGARQFVAARPAMGRFLGRTLIMVAAATAVIGGPKFYRTWQLHQTMLTAQAEIQKQLPKRVNAYTTLVGVRVGYTDWTYLYTVTVRKSEIDLPALERQVRKGLCGTSDMKAMLNDGVSYIYEYRDTSGVLVGRFEITACP